MKWTIKQFAEYMGVSVRTLHYYDEIGLLKPSSVNEQSGYRFYDCVSYARMQDILFFREFDFSLERIGKLLSASEQDRRAALIAQKQQLVSKKERLERLISLAESVEQGESMEKLIDSFVKDTVTLDPRTVTFYELLEEADMLLENDTVNEQLVLVKTAKGNIYHTCNQITSGYDEANDRAFMDMLREKEDTEVRFLVALWNPRAVPLLQPDLPYAPDIPGWCLRKGLVELDSANEETLVLLLGEGVYHARTLKSLQPPKK